MKKPGFFDVEERLARLNGFGDPLEAFSRSVDFEAFRPDRDKALAYADGSKALVHRLIRERPERV